MSPRVREDVDSVCVELENAPRVIASTQTCMLCGSAIKITSKDLKDTRFGIDGLYQIGRCVDCGLNQTYPAPSPTELKELYERHYNFGGQIGTAYSRLREYFLLSIWYRMWVRLDGDISFHLRRGSSRLIDIGCNEGRGLRIYARNGFQVEGLELNETAAGEARKLGFVVHTGTLEELDQSAHYDVAVLSNVLEHATDPRRMLSDVGRILPRAGEVWISCPNIDSWLRRVFGRYWINWHVPFHLSHFSAKTLSLLLQETGYTSISVRQITPSLWLSQSIIAYLFATDGKKTRQLRNPFLTTSLMFLTRLLLFPILWLGNRRGKGDCLIVTATKG